MGLLELFKLKSDVESNTSDVADNTEAVAGLVGSLVVTVRSSAATGYLMCFGETIGNVGSGADHESADYETLFDLLKSSWGNAGTESFAGLDTVLLPDMRGMFARGAGQHGSLTMANGNPYQGPALGASENDQLQGHWHDIIDQSRYASAGGGSLVGMGSGSSASAVIEPIRSPVTDGTNGTPRSGDETRPIAFGVNYMIKY